MTVTLSLLAILICLVTVTTTSDGSYEMLRVKAESAKQMNELIDLEGSQFVDDIAYSKSGVVDFFVPIENVARVKNMLHSQFGLKAKEMSGSWPKLAMDDVTAGEDSVFSYDAYHRLKAIYGHLDDIATQHPDKAEVFSLAGKTYEDREIKAVKISKDVSTSDSKPLIWLDGGIHAREWVSPSTVMYIIDTLLGVHEQNLTSQVDKLLEKYQFVIAPCINPDGYEFSHTKKRLWRKTRKPSGCDNNERNWWGGCFSQNCWGADPNRNWDSDWANKGVSDNPCSLVYPGSKAFDQANTAAVRDQLLEYSSRIKLYVTYHSYSQLFLTPLGYTMDKTPDHEHHVVVGNAVVKAIKGRYGTEYTPMISAGLYPASGDSADWVYENLKVSDSYTIELRDTGRWGFVLPPDQIIPTGAENVDGLLALIENIAFNNQ